MTLIFLTSRVLHFRFNHGVFCKPPPQSAAVWLTCPLSRKTERFNKASLLTRLSLRGTTSLWASLDWISSGRFIVLFSRTEAEQSTWNRLFQWSWFIFSNATEENRAAERTSNKRSPQSAARILSLFEGTVISHKHTLPIAQRHKSKWKSSFLVPVGLL